MFRRRFLTAAVVAAVAVLYSAPRADAGFKLDATVVGGGSGSATINDNNVPANSASGSTLNVLDTNIGPNKLTVTREATFPPSSPTEIAYILVLRTLFPNGFTATVRGVFTYTVNDEGLITNLRGYWNMDAMEFGQEEGGGD